MIKVRRKVHLLRRDHGRLVMADADPRAPAVQPGRIPRVSRLMALAIHFDRLIREGKLADQSELARLAHVTQPRMTQIMNLNHLAPDIQEYLLHSPRTPRGREALNEKSLRPVAAQILWSQQRELWRRVIDGGQTAFDRQGGTPGSGCGETVRWVAEAQPIAVCGGHWH